MRDQIGCPTYTGHLAAGLVRLLDGEDYGVHHMAGGGRCSWYDFAVEIFKQAGRRLPRAVDDQRHARPARPRGPPTRCWSASASTPCCCRTGTRASRTTSPSAPGGRCAREAARHRRRRASSARTSRATSSTAHPEDEVVVLDKLTYAGPRGDDRGSDRRRALHLRAGGHHRSGARPRGARGLRRDRQLRGRVARRPLDRRAGPLHPDRRVRHVRAARGGPRRRHRALPAGLHRRGLRVDRGRLVHRAQPARPLLSVLGVQGGRRPARVRATATPTA